MPTPAYCADGCYVADGKVYTGTTIPYEDNPSFRGHCLYAYNAQTGAQIWNVSGECTMQAIADSILLAYNTYDGEEYAFEAGPTATTVWAPSNFADCRNARHYIWYVADQTPRNCTRHSRYIRHMDDS